MSGELSIRSTYFLRGFSPRTFYEPCIQKLFSTFQIYLFHCFYVCFLKGHGEKLFGKVLLQGCLFNHAYKNYFQLFKFIYSIYFMFVF